MSITVILGIVGTVLSIVLIWFKGAKKRDKSKVWADFKAIEVLYRKALATGAPRKVSRYSKQMQEMRDKYKFLKR